MLEAHYLIFNEGYAATAGDAWIRPALCEEALRLGRVLAELAPNEPEVHGLVGLMELQASRLRARIGPSGEPVLLLDQDRARWDQLLIRRGLTALERAAALGGALGPYALQGAIAACHARARDPEETERHAPSRQPYVAPGRTKGAERRVPLEAGEACRRGGRRGVGVETLGRALRRFVKGNGAVHLQDHVAHSHQL